MGIICQIAVSFCTLLTIFFPSWLYAGTCRLESTAQVISNGEKLDLSFHIKNLGDERASSVVLEIYSGKEIVRSQYTGDLGPNQSQNFFVSLPRDINSNLLFSFLRYTVSTGIEYSYPVNVYVSPSDLDPYLDLKAFFVYLIDISDLKLLIANRSNVKKQIKITPILPYEIKAEPSFRYVTLFPNGQEYVSFRLLNRWAPVNSQYPGYFVVEEEMGKVVGCASYTIFIRPHGEKGLGLMGLLVSILIILGLLEISNVFDYYSRRKDECL